MLFDTSPKHHALLIRETDYYTDTLTKTRTSAIQEHMERVLKTMAWEDGTIRTNIGQILASFEKTAEVDMDEQACTEALADLNAYYKVSNNSLDPRDITDSRRLL